MYLSTTDSGLIKEGFLMKTTLFNLALGTIFYFSNSDIHSANELFIMSTAGIVNLRTGICFDYELDPEIIDSKYVETIQSLDSMAILF